MDLRTLEELVITARLREQQRERDRLRQIELDKQQRLEAEARRIEALAERLRGWIVETFGVELLDLLTPDYFLHGGASGVMVAVFEIDGGKYRLFPSVNEPYVWHLTSGTHQTKVKTTPMATGAVDLPFNFDQVFLGIDRLRMAAGGTL